MTLRKKGSKKSLKVKKPKTSLRQRNKKAAESKNKPKRIRKAANTAVKSSSKVKEVLTQEYHLINRRENPGFFTKSRKLTPAYFRNALKELRLVSWPGFRETWKLVFAVFVFAILMGLVIAILDFGFEKVFREIIL